MEGETRGWIRVRKDGVSRLRNFQKKTYSREGPNWRREKRGDDRAGQVINRYRVGQDH